MEMGCSIWLENEIPFGLNGLRQSYKMSANIYNFAFNEVVYINSRTKTVLFS